jgi:hypothetical protein
MNPFELYEPQRSSSSGRGVPTVRALSGGRLVLNAAAVRLIGETAFVQLLWDAEAKKIGLKPTTEADPAGFRVTRAPSQAIITSKGFIDANSIPYSQRMKLELDGEIWVASTTDPGHPLG